VSKIGSRFSFKDIKVLSREPVFSRFLKVDIVQLKHKMFNGGWSPVIKREVTVRERAVGVLMFDPKRDEIVLVKQFRIGVMQDLEEPWILEIVAGMVGDGENFLDVANREAKEESGCEILDLIDICEYYNSPGISTEKVILYCGIIDAENAGGIHGLEKEHEDIEVIVLSYKDALGYLESGYINNAMSIIALQWLILNKNAIINQWL